MVDVLMISDGSTLPRIAWDSILDDATISSANATESDGAVGNVADWTPWTFWRPNDVGPYIIEADLSGAQTVRAWAFCGHDVTGLVGMDTWDGAAWVAHSEAILVAGGLVSYLIGLPVSTTKLRFRFASLTFVSMIWAGVDMILPEGIGSGWTDPNLALRAEVTPEATRDGIWLGNAVLKWDAQLDLSIRNVEDSWARDYWLPFLRTCSTRPFFLHWNTVEWPTSACLCTSAKFGTTAFSQKGFIDVAVSFMADPGFDRRQTPDSDSPALLLEDASGPLLLEN